MLSCSKLQDVAEFDVGEYKVLLFSIVKINDEYRVRVDITDERHFILPKNHQQVKMDDIEWWNKQRLTVALNGCHIKFLCEAKNHRARCSRFEIYGILCKK